MVKAFDFSAFFIGKAIFQAIEFKQCLSAIENHFSWLPETIKKKKKK